MRAVIRTNDVKIEFSGRGQLWNELLRPQFGGPEAPNEDEAAAPASPQLIPHRMESQEPSPVRHAPRVEPAAAPSRPAAAAPSQPRTWYPPRPAPAPASAPRRFEPPKAAPASYYSAEEDDADAGPRVEPSADPATLYGRLAALPGRRSERDAVLASVWFLTKGESETTADEVERHLVGFRAFPDVKVPPHLMKHVHRTKMLEFGASPKTVKLSKKGLGYVKGRLVPE